MKHFLSEKIQLLLLVSLLVLSFIVMVSFLIVFDRYLVNKWYVDCFNFIGKLEPSGALVFAGIAAGLTYTAHRLLFYRNMVFMFGFVFAICQAVISARGSIYVLEPEIMVLMYITLTSGVGFIFFSFLAIAAYEYDRRNEKNDDLKSENKEANNKYINLNPSVKNGSEQISHVPSGLAHDLRYSRSRARRSPRRH